MVFIKNIILIFVMIFLSESCSTIQTNMDATKKYKQDLYIENKEFSGVGMLVLPKKDLYSIIFESDGKMDAFFFRTCSREIFIEDARRGLNRKQVQVNYRPNEIEATTTCPAHVQAVSQDGGYSVGFVDFENGIDTVKARLMCGEHIQSVNGASVCQGRVGLIQKIDFDEEMVVSPYMGCENIKSENGTWQGKGFIINIERDYCSFVFMQKKGEHKTHRLTTYGYEDILIRR